MTTPTSQPGHALTNAIHLTVEAFVTHPDGTTEGEPAGEPSKDGAA